MDEQPSTGKTDEWFPFPVLRWAISLKENVQITPQTVSHHVEPWQQKMIPHTFTPSRATATAGAVHAENSDFLTLHGLQNASGARGSFLKADLGSTTS